MSIKPFRPAGVPAPVAERVVARLVARFLARFVARDLATPAAVLCAGLCACALLATPAFAHSYQLGAITIEHPHAGATVPGQPTGGGYMTLVNAGPDDRLLSASADISKSTQIHEMKMQGDVMKMRELDALDLPAGKTVALQPGAFHLMFVGLKAPLKAGEQFPLKLHFEKAGDITVSVHVEAANATDTKAGKDSMPAMPAMPGMTH